jgi:hypothetical protein
MTSLQRFVQYIIILGAVINTANFALNLDRYVRETHPSSQPAVMESQSNQRKLN